MTMFHLFLPLVEEYTRNELRELCASATEGIIIQVPYDHIRRITCRVDIANGCIDALFVGEAIVDYCRTISVYEHENSAFFVLQPMDIDGLVNQVFWLAPGFSHDALMHRRAEFERIQSAIQEFEHTLGERNLRFPLLADSYLVNHIASSHDRPDTVVMQEHHKHPERRYGYGRSFASNNFGFDFYVSHEAYIIPPKVDAEYFIRTYANTLRRNCELQSLRGVLCQDVGAVDCCEDETVYYPGYRLDVARSCAMMLWGTHVARTEPTTAPSATIVVDQASKYLVITDHVAGYIFLTRGLKTTAYHTKYL